MGVHLAFHQNPINIAIHALFSIINAWAVLLIAYPFQVFGLTIIDIPIDFAMATLLLMFCVYARMEIGGAIVTTALFSATYPLCEPTYALLGESAWMMAGLGVLLTILALAVQVFVGHGIAEDGIDEAMDNFAEAYETKNPTYIALLPFYTYLDLMFKAGYRSKLAHIIDDITTELRPKLLAAQTNINANNSGDSTNGVNS